MTISEVYDRLLAVPVSQIDWKDGTAPLLCTGGPMLVRDMSTSENADGWVEACEEGFCLHFMALDQNGEWRPHEEPLSNIARVI